MFSKAPIRRFNDANPDPAPPLGAYNPFYETDVQNVALKCSNTRLAGSPSSTKPRSRPTSSGQSTTTIHRRAVSKSPHRASKRVSSRSPSEFFKRSVSKSPTRPAGNNAKVKTSVNPEKTKPITPSRTVTTKDSKFAFLRRSPTSEDVKTFLKEKEEWIKKEAALQTLLTEQEDIAKDLQKKLDMLANNAETNKLNWRKIEDELISNNRSLQKSMDEMVEYVSSLEKEKEVRVGVVDRLEKDKEDKISMIERLEKQVMGLKCDRMGMARNLEEAQRRILDFEKQFQETETALQESEKKCAHLEKEMDHCYSKYQDEIKMAKKVPAEKLMDLTEAIEKAKKNEEGLKTALVLEKAKTLSLEKRVEEVTLSQEMTEDTLSSLKREWSMKEDRLNKEIKSLEDQLKVHFANPCCLQDKVVLETSQHILQTRQENSELRKMLDSCQKFAAEVRADLPSSPSGNNNKPRSASCRSNPVTILDDADQQPFDNKRVDNWTTKLGSLRTSDHALNPKEISETLIAQIEKDKDTEMKIEALQLCGEETPLRPSTAETVDVEAEIGSLQKKLSPVITTEKWVSGGSSTKEGTKTDLDLIEKSSSASGRFGALKPLTPIAEEEETPRSIKFSE